jgi:6-phosphofructokinase
MVKKYMPSHYVGVCILGHVQRGDSLSAADRILASKFGFEAIEGEKRYSGGSNKERNLFYSHRLS